MVTHRIRTPLVWCVLATVALLSQVVTAAPPAKRPNQPPTVRITSAGHDNSLIAPATISITAEASDEDGTIKSVKFFAGAIAIANAVTAPFSITWDDVPAGVYALTAVATDNSGATTTSAPVRITVVPNRPPNVRITSAGRGNPLIAPATIAINAEASDADGTVKSVAFFAGAAAIGTALAPPFKVTWEGVAAGAYVLTAVATDNRGATTTSAPVPVTVLTNARPTVRITSPANGANYTAPAVIALTAEASDADGKIAGVRFFVDGRHLGGKRHAPYTATIKHAAAGTYHVTAIATDNLGAETTSDPLTIVVAPNPPPTVAITSPPNGQKFAPSDAITISASAGDSGGGTIKAVRFFADSVWIGTTTHAPYTVIWVGAALGPHTLTAVAIDNAGLRTTSPQVDVTVASPDPNPVPDPSTLPLVQQNALAYEGAFRLPGNLRDSFGTGFGDGGAAVAFNPARDSLFLVGYDGYQQVAELAVPPIINSPVLSDLAIATTVLQPFTEVTEGLLYTINPGDGNAKLIGGMLPYLGHLYVTGYAYYDALKTQVLSHFVSGLDFSVQGDVAGPYQVGTAGASYVSGYFGLVPTEWQDALGGPVLNGNCCLPIITRTSYGPAAFTIDPTQLGVVDPLPATPLVYYPSDHHTLGDWDQQSSVFNGTSEVTGVVFPEHTRSVLFFGRHGLGPFCYGIGGATGGDCYDPAYTYKGTHAYPYEYYVWAYDANDLAAVKRGEKQPWDVTPYAYWPLNLPFANNRARIRGATYDPATNRIFVSQAFGEDDQPVIYVFSVQLP
jgi:hypothetical protein